MKKIVDIYKRYKEIKSIPRYNALIKLGLYLIFFIIVGFLLSTIKPINKTNNSYTKSMYNFKYTINNDVIIGKKDNNIEFIYNDIDYKILNNEITCNSEDCNIEFKYLFDLFTLDKLNDYIKNGTIISKTEYMDGSLEYKYNIDNMDVKKYFESDLTFELSKKDNIYTINLENYNILDKIIFEYK